MCQIDIAKSVGRRIYRATTAYWHQIWIWFGGNFKGFRVEIEVLSATFDWISNQQLNVCLFAVRLTLPKIEVDVFTWLRRESDVRKGNDL